MDSQLNTNDFNRNVTKKIFYYFFILVSIALNTIVWIYFSFDYKEINILACFICANTLFCPNQICYWLKNMNSCNNSLKEKFKFLFSSYAVYLIAYPIIFYLFSIYALFIVFLLTTLTNVSFIIISLLHNTSDPVATYYTENVRINYDGYTTMEAKILVN